MTHLVPVLRPVLGSPFRRGDLYRRAGEIPSFHISPAALGHARDLITGAVIGTYNSASPAMAVGADGLLFTPAANAPVIEYNPVTRACLGARIWGVVTQQARATRDLTQSTVWTASAITPTRDQVGTDGTANSATRLTATASDGTILQTFTSASATRVSGFWVRRITGTGTVEITMNGGSTWTALTLTSTFARYSIPAATITNPQIGFRIRSNGDEIAVDGVQLQSVATLGPTVFNPSTTLTASTTADVWSITGADFNRIVNQSEGTVYIDYGPIAVEADVNNSLWYIGSNVFSNLNVIDAFVGANRNTVLRVNSENVTQAYINTSPELAQSINHRIANAYKLNDYASSVDNRKILTDTLGNLPATAADTLYIGSVNGIGIKPLNGYIRELAIFRSRRPDANLQALTT